jgi:hypothetical protein
MDAMKGSWINQTILMPMAMHTLPELVEREPPAR